MEIYETWWFFTLNIWYIWTSVILDLLLYSLIKRIEQRFEGVRAENIWGDWTRSDLMIMLLSEARRVTGMINQYCSETQMIRNTDKKCKDTCPQVPPASKTAASPVGDWLVFTNLIFRIPLRERGIHLFCGPDYVIHLSCQSECCLLLVVYTCSHDHRSGLKSGMFIG